MDVKETIEKRRAYRSLEKMDISEDLIIDLAECARLSASCFNNQPWRFIFVTNKTILSKLHETLSKGNEWAKKASLIIVVFSKKDYDCVLKEREYYLFDTGMAVAQIILRATELGLVAHPIAGFSPKKIREILQIPETMNIITLIIIGMHSETLNPDLTQKQIETEKRRPERLPLKSMIYIDKYKYKF